MLLQKIEGNLQKKLRTDNLGRLASCQFCILLLIPFMEFAHFEIIQNKYCSSFHYYCRNAIWCSLYWSYLFYSLPVNLQIYKSNSLEKGLTEFLFSFQFNFFLSVFALSSLASQLFSGNISFFTTGVVFMAALFVTFKRYATILYTFSLVFFLFGLYKIQNNSTLFIFK